WAFLIGIDAYNDTRDSLQGCVSDALAFRKYLTEVLKVPAEKIQLLLSPNPKPNIIRTLINISTSTKIQPGDQIILYFSGHGTSYPCATYFTDTIGGQGNIEALCPMDRGSIIPDISDREINIILKQICRSKGHRITVFLDCCHSASGTRG
ncbi:peptidase C14, caspase domain-containing protein, partial [Desarmillaria ectypa]